MTPWTWVKWTESGTPHHGRTHTYGGVCPDVLRYEQLCGAETARGCVILAFFWLMEFWPKRWRRA